MNVGTSAERRELEKIGTGEHRYWGTRIVGKIGRTLVGVGVEVVCESGVGCGVGIGIGEYTDSVEVYVVRDLFPAGPISVIFVL